jgi:hypothetical protein
LVLLATHGASASPAIVSYDLLNGNIGAYGYLDRSYTGGTGDPNAVNATLSGGHGKLTDGVVATDRWDVDGYDGTNSYVGWYMYRVPSPTLTLHLDAPLSGTSTVTIWVDDADGAGHVNAPHSVTINGVAYDFVDPTPASDGIPKLCSPGCGTFADTMPFGNTFVGDWTTDTLVLDFDYADHWIMLSEIAIDYPTPTTGVLPNQIPEPGTLAIFGLGLAGLGFARRRRRTA